MTAAWARARLVRGAKRMLAVAAVGLAMACQSTERQVTVWAKSGQVVTGVIVRSDSTTMVLRDASGALHEIPRQRIATMAVSSGTAAASGGASPPLAPETETRSTLTVPAGTPLAATLRTAVASSSAQPGMRVEAELAAPFVIEGQEIAPAGAALTGTVTRVQRGGAEGVRAGVVLRFDRLMGGLGPLPIDTAPVERQGRLVRRGNRVVGALGSIIGRRQSEVGADVSLPAGTRLQVSLAAPLAVEMPAAARR